MRNSRRMFLLLAALVLVTGCAAKWQQGEVVVVQEDKASVQILAGQSTSDAGSEEMIESALRESFPDVDFQWVCVDWGDGFAPQMTSRFAAGKMPDILIGKAQDVPVYQALGAILPVSAQACVNVAPEALALTAVEGEVYGLPYNSLCQGVLYNKDIFEKLGLSVPETRKELEQAVAVCEAAGITSFAAHYGDVWAVGNVTMQLWMNDLFLQYPQLEADFETMKPLIEDAFLQCRYMKEHSFSDAMQINQTECDKRFARGEAAMFMTGTWTLQTLSQQTPDLKVGIFPYPNTTGDARLLEETNLTFMKGNTGKDTVLVDEILMKIGSDQGLAAEIAEFTTASSTFTALAGTGGTLALSEGAAYRESGRIANVATGNSQFAWPFQMEVAQRTVQWLEGKLSMDALLQYVSQGS